MLLNNNKIYGENFNVIYLFVLVVENRRVTLNSGSNSNIVWKQYIILNNGGYKLILKQFYD